MQDKLDSQQIRKTSAILGIPTDFIRKDYFVTKVIHTLTQIQDDYFELIFQGGTSLSKGYQVIHRMSEDVDFRVIQKCNAQSLGKEVRRKKLRDFRHKLISQLKKSGFAVSEETIRVLYSTTHLDIDIDIWYNSVCLN